MATAGLIPAGPSSSSDNVSMSVDLTARREIIILCQ